MTIYRGETLVTDSIGERSRVKWREIMKRDPGISEVNRRAATKAATDTTGGEQLIFAWKE